MPTVFKIDKLKFKIYSRDHNLPHVHVEKAEAVFDLKTLRLIHSSGFEFAQIRQIQEHVRELQEYLLEIWNENK